MFKLKLIKKPILFKLKCNFSFPPIVLANMQEKIVIPTTDKQIVTPDENYTGLSKVTVDKIPNEYIIPRGNIEIIENGIYNVREKETANVNIPMLKLGTKNITENGIYKASDDNLDGYSEVNVGIKSLFTGSYDRQGLKQIGWTDEEIEYYQQNGVQWNASEDDYFKLTNTELAGDESSNTRFLPKNSTKKSFNGYYRLLAIPLLDTSSLTNMGNMFYYCYSLTTIPQLDTSNVISMSSMFQNCYSLKTIPLLDTSSVTNMSYMFQYCSSLTTIPQLDTSKVINMSNMFQNCGSLSTIPLLDTSSVKNMSNMFYYCYSLTTIPLLDTSNVTNMSYMFQNCYSLKTIPQLDTSKVTDMSTMLYGCYSLKIIPQLDTISVKNMSNMFYNCYSLTAIPLLDTSSVTNMSYMFQNCFSLKTIPQLDTSNVTNMGYMFSNCRKITEVPQLDTSSVTSINNAFGGCISLITLPELNLIKAINISNMFQNCPVLENLDGFANLGQAYSTKQSANYGSYKLDLSKSTKLTEQSLINVLTNLYDIKTKGCKTQQVVLGSTNLAKLTSTEGQSALSNAQAKGWTVS